MITSEPTDIRISDLDARQMATLNKLYSQEAITTDRLPYTAAINRIALGMDDPQITPGHIYHLLVTLRKAGKLPQLTKRAVPKKKKRVTAA